jgi:hypothetical protein
MACTCGACVGGFLSARNAAAMRAAANLAAEMIRDTMPDFPGA